MKMNLNDRDKIIQLTPLWKGERLPDGRPKVEDKYLDALYGMTLEEVWKPIFVLGYEHQFVGGGENPLNTLHDDGRKLVGRAVTCTYCPTRPDLHDVQFARGAEDGLQGNYNQWVIDHLYERDVVVCDMYDKIYKGTFLGGNLTTALHNRTKTGGAVIWGGIRDVEQMKKVPDVQVYYRGIDPTPIREFVMKDWNDIITNAYTGGSAEYEEKGLGQNCNRGLRAGGKAPPRYAYILRKQGSADQYGKIAVASVIGMIITVFLIFLFFLLSQQVFGWAKTVYIEMIYR